MAHVAHSLKGTANFGHSLAVALETYSEGAPRYRRSRLLIVHICINSTASSLRQLRDLINNDRESIVPKSVVFNDDGILEICRLVAQCKKLYSVVIALLHKAGEISTDEERKVELPTHPRRALGSFEEEQALRCLAEKALKRRVAAANKIEEKRVKEIDDAASTESASDSADEEAQSIKTTSTATVDPPLSSFPPPPPMTPKTLVDLDEPESLEKKEDSIKEEVKSDTIKKADDSPVKEIVASAPQKSFHIIPAWIRRIFSQDIDWETEQLEAILLELPVRFDSKPETKVTKLELDDKQVKDTLTKLTSRNRFKRRPQLLEQYKHLDRRIRREVDGAVTYVRHGSTTNRDWIAMEIVSPSVEKGQLLANHLDISIMLFFRIGDEVEPIRLKDAIGRMLILPYEQCRTLEDMQKILSKTLWESSTVATQVQEGHYEVSHQDGTVIPRGTWKSIVRPGMSLEMKMWQLDLPHRPGLGMPIPMGWGRIPGARHPGMAPLRIIDLEPPSMKPSLIKSKKQARKEKQKAKLAVTREINELIGWREEDWSRENEQAKLKMGHLLGMWTNALDTRFEEEEEEDSDTSSVWSGLDFNTTGNSPETDSSSGSTTY
ncbi:hypothetical protein QQX98_005513 [Neonectria punicea]|uniref:Ubiquitin-like domain-containing protein n=1 Tax=Neonectria punicea TaxID=979145 RepID=A0ABR1H4G9_9HYPO